jgi:hypothetical protein
MQIEEVVTVSSTVLIHYTQTSLTPPEKATFSGHFFSWVLTDFENEMLVGRRSSQEAC